MTDLASEMSKKSGAHPLRPLAAGAAI